MNVAGLGGVEILILFVVLGLPVLLILGVVLLVRARSGRS